MQDMTKVFYLYKAMTDKPYNTNQSIIKNERRTLIQRAGYNLLYTRKNFNPDLEITNVKSFLMHEKN